MLSGPGISEKVSLYSDIRPLTPSEREDSDATRYTDSTSADTDGLYGSLAERRELAGKQILSCGKGITGPRFSATSRRSTRPSFTVTDNPSARTRFGSARDNIHENIRDIRLTPRPSQSRPIALETKNKRCPDRFDQAFDY